MELQQEKQKMKPELLRESHNSNNQAWGLLLGKIVDRGEKGKIVQLSDGTTFSCAVLGRVYHTFKKFNLNPQEDHLFGVWIKTLKGKKGMRSRVTISQIIRPGTEFYRKMAEYEGTFAIKGKISAKNFNRKMVQVEVCADKKEARPFNVQLFGVVPRYANIDSPIEVQAKLKGQKLWIEKVYIPRSKFAKPIPKTKIRTS